MLANKVVLRYCVDRSTKYRLWSLQTHNKVTLYNKLQSDAPILDHSHNLLITSLFI